MKSLPSIVIAGSGLSPLAAKLSLTLLLLLPLPLPFSAGRDGRGIQHFASRSDSFGLPDEGLSSSWQGCGTAWWDQAMTFSIPLEAKNANLFTAS